MHAIQDEAVNAVEYKRSACASPLLALQADSKPDVASNAYRDNNKPFRAPRLAYLQVRCCASALPLLLLPL